MNKMNIKKIWSGIREIVNIRNNISTKITQLIINGKIIDNPKDVANQLNDFFVNVGPLTESSIPRSENISPNKFLKKRNQFDFFLAHVSHDEVFKIINTLQNKSAGPASIPVKLLKLIPDLIIIPLCNIINLSFVSGSFPDPLKIAKVIPIHKNGSTQDMSNYRPISLLSIFDKIMEKIMHKRLYKFLELNNILYSKQFGLRKNNSTIDALIKITDKIRESVDKGKYGCGIFIDLRKAFDTVNHNILLLKMEHYGVRGPSLQWFRSYLSERKQYVYINGECSELKQISCGVPQGSVLGPLLFLIYINDLPNISKKLDLYLFADDTNIYYEDKSLENLEIRVNKELKNLYLWLSVNRLVLNIEKTNFVIFHPFNKPLKYNVTILIHKKAITEKKSIKYLGILIDSTLSWKDHITNLSKKLSRTVGILYKLRPFVNLKIMKDIYYALFYSHLVYGIHVWGSACDSSLNIIQVLQKRVVRLVTYNDTLPVFPGPLPASSPLFVKLGFLNLKDIFKFQISIFIHKCLYLRFSDNFKDWFTLNHTKHDYITRHNYSNPSNKVASNSLFIPQARTSNYGLKMLKVKGPKIWNSLPPVIRTTQSPYSFKRSLKLHFISTY